MRTDPRRIDRYSFDGGLDEEEEAWTVFEVCETLGKFFRSIGCGLYKLASAVARFF